ncbi:transposase [Streptomyces sp. CB02488]|uniref:IS5/IS1182 family transposase n=1 Tax=Streptomyces sp. CB02488 TaxID=1703920 RepID=UPI00093DFA87|nr:IS5/IS1182 family transposase [Streptomyces sp. CB02488]OKK09744.1 transposase [Streptomyces sp. CB02488]
MIEPVITAWKGRHRSVSGHQGAYDMREIVNAILYQGRTGCQWAYLPQKSATYYYFATWRDDGTDQVIHELLRRQVRERARRSEDPALVILDTQSVHVAAGAPADTSGHDPAKRVPGRTLGIDVEIVARDPQIKRFVPQPKRWRAEQTYGTLILHRRLVRDYEHHPSSSVSRVYWAMTHVMTRRLTGANTPTWREAQAVAA